MCDADTSLQVGESDPHRVPLEEARVISGRAGKTNPAWNDQNTYLILLLWLVYRFTINVFQDFGVQVRLFKKGDDDLGGSAVLSPCDDFGESCLVREWRELEDVIGTNFTGQILSECSGDVKQIKAAIIKADKEYSACLVKCSPLHSGCCKSAG